MIPKTMRQVAAKGGAGIEALKLETVDTPQPAAGEALVRLNAATLNYRDLMNVRGDMPGTWKEPTYVPLSCGAGEVVAIGAGVDRVKVGDRVIPAFVQGWISGGMENMGRRHLGGGVDGVACEYAVFEQDGLVHTPDALSDLEAATLPCAALTAWSSLYVARKTQPGDVVLLQGTGGVSIAALQLAKAGGATVIITSSSPAKLNRARALGADHLIDYTRTADWGAAAREITGGRGVDLVVDVVGTPGIDQSAAALAPEGLLAAIGKLGGDFAWNAGKPVNLAPIAAGNRDGLEAMLRAISANQIRPVVDQVFPLTRLADAMNALKEGRLFGKIGIDLSL